MKSLAECLKISTISKKDKVALLGKRKIYIAEGTNPRDAEKRVVFEELAALETEAERLEKLIAEKVPKEEALPTEKVEGAEIIPFSKDLDIRNLDQLPRGVGARYLEVIKGEGNEYVAKQWRRKPIEKGILIDFEKLPTEEVEEVKPEEKSPYAIRKSGKYQSEYTITNAGWDILKKTPYAEKLRQASTRETLGSKDQLKDLFYLNNSPYVIPENAGFTTKDVLSALSGEALPEKVAEAKPSVEAKVTKPKKPRPIRDFRDWIRQNGGIRSNDPTLKGELRDVAWTVKKGRKVLAKGFGFGFFNNEALASDEITLKAIQAGWLPEGATEDDLLNLITENPKSHPSAVEKDIDKIADKEIIEELEDRYGPDFEESDEFRRDQDLAEEEVKREIQGSSQAEIAREDEFTDLEKEAITEESRKLDDSFDFGIQAETFKLEPTEPVSKEEQIAWGRMQGKIKAPEKVEKPRAVIPTNKIQTGIHKTDQESLFGKELRKGETKNLFDKIEEPGIQYVYAPTVPYNQQSLFDFRPAKRAEGEKIPKPLGQRVVVRTTGNIQWAGNVISSYEDVASLLASIRKSAQENLYTVTVDKNGVILEIHRYVKGPKSAASIFLTEISGRVLNIEDAFGTYIVHNHPTGDPSPSTEDYNLVGEIQKILKPNNIEMMGITIGKDTYQTMKQGTEPFENPTPIPPAIRKISLPIKERFLVNRAKTQGLKSIDNSITAREAIKDYGNNEDGVLLVDRKNYPLVFVPFIEGRSMADTTTDIIKSAEQTNASGAIINSTTTEENQKRYVSTLFDYGIGDIQVLDWIDRGTSVRDSGVKSGTQRARGLESYEVLLSNDVVIRVKDFLSSQKGSLSFQKIKGTPVYDDLLTVGRDIYSQGHTRYAEFVGQMKATFVDVWEKIKNIVRHIFNEVRKTAEIGKRKLTEEAGTISLEKKAVPEPEVRQPDYKAEADAWIKNYLAKSETAQKEKNLQPLLEGQLEKEIGIKKEMPSKEPDWKNELFGTTKQPRFHKITDAIEDVRNNWRTRIFDRLDPIKTELGEQAYMLHRLETGIQGVMATFMRHGIPRWNGQAITVDTRHKGFLEWYKGLGKDGEGLLYWIAAKRAEQLETEGREQWLTEKERNKIFKSVGDKPVTATSWDELNKQFQRYNKGVLDLAEHSGLINPDAREKWEQHFYVPFYRIFESEITKEEFLKGPVWSKRHIDAQIKRLMGANMKIGDPLENVIRNWTHLIHESMRNMARAEGFNSAQKLGLKTIQKVEKKDLIRVLGSKKQKRYAVMKEGSETASAIFDEKEEAEAWAYHLSDRYNKEYHVSPRVTTSILFGNMKDNNILSFQENGQRTYFKVIDPELFNALSGLNKERFDNIIMKMFRTSKRWLTYGATFGPAFRVRNMFRDTIHTAIISKSFMPFVDSFKGFAKAMREDQDFVKLAASGAAFGSSYVRADDATTLAKYIKRITTKEGEGAIEKILDTPKKLLDWWEKIGSASENAARVSLYAQRIKEGREHLEAAFEARDLLDFTMQGDAGVVQFLIQALPFANARMQGLYKLGRAAGGNPTGFIIKGGILTAASLMLWALNHDKDEWKELEDWEKWTYYHFWVGNNHYRIPKPFEVGAIFSSLFETTADTMTKDEEIQFLGRYIQYTFQDTFAMNPMPQLVRPLIEQWANKSFFTGRPIEGEFLKGLKPGERKDVWTSKTMQELGAIGIPPKRAEELIRGYFSTFGMFLLGISDSIVSHVGDFPKDPSMRIDHYPLVGSFIREREGATHSKYITRFYDTMNEIDQLVGTINFYKKVGDYKRAQELSLESKESLTIKPSLNKIRKNLSLINAQTKIIYHSTTMTPKEKRKKLDNLIEQRNKYTKQAVELIKKFGNK